MTNNERALILLNELIAKIEAGKVEVNEFVLEQGKKLDEKYLKVPDGNHTYTIRFSE